MTEIWDLEIGETLEHRYLLIDKLGDGGFGMVWEVEDLEAKRDRKVIKVCTSSDHEVVAVIKNLCKLGLHRFFITAFQQAKAGKTRPISEMWDGIDAE